MKQVAIILGIASILTGSTYLLGDLATDSPTLFLPNLIRFWVAGVLLGIYQAFKERAFPQFSIRLLNSSIVAGVLFMAMPSVLWLWSARVLPLTFVMVCIALVPVWIHIFSQPMEKAFHLAGTLSIVGLVCAAFFVPARPLNALSACTGAMFLSAAAGCLARRLYWIHASVNLNLWSMVCAAVILLPMALLTGEISFLPQWNTLYWIKLALLTVVGTAGGAIFYRQFSFKISSSLLTICLVLPPVAILFLEMLRGSVVPFQIVGYFIALIPLVQLSHNRSASQWMCHYLASSNRNGDRLDVDINGFLKTEKGQGGPARIKSISIGGLGFESDTYCPVADRIAVTLPLGKNFSQITFDTICAYISKTNGGKYVWTGGLAFVKMNLEMNQVIAEFVARLSTVSASEEPAVEIRKEYA